MADKITITEFRNLMCCPIEDRDHDGFVSPKDRIKNFAGDPVSFKLAVDSFESVKASQTTQDNGLYYRIDLVRQLTNLQVVDKNNDGVMSYGDEITGANGKSLRDKNNTTANYTLAVESVEAAIMTRVIAAVEKMKSQIPANAASMGNDFPANIIASYDDAMAAMRLFKSHNATFNLSLGYLNGAIAQWQQFRAGALNQIASQMGDILHER